MSQKHIDAFLADGNPPPEGAGIFGGLCSRKDASLLLIPVPWEPTTSYGKGAAEGAGGIVTASHYLDLEDLAFGRPYLEGIHMLADTGPIDALNTKACELTSRLRDGGSNLSDDERGSLTEQVNDLSASVNHWVEETARTAMAAGQLVGVVGGDHSAPFGLISLLSQQKEPFGILHIDAHFDLRRAYEGFTFSHASIMYNVLEHCPHVQKLVQVGIRDFSAEEKQLAEASSERIDVFYDRSLFRAKAEGITFAALAKEIIAQLPNRVYVSFDIDGLQPGFCPSTGTPVPGGLDMNEAFYIIEELVASGKKVIGFDLCEVGQPKDGSDWDLNVGARVLYKLCGALLKSQGNRL